MIRNKREAHPKSVLKSVELPLWDMLMAVRLLQCEREIVAGRHRSDKLGRGERERRVQLGIASGRVGPLQSVKAVAVTLAQRLLERIVQLLRLRLERLAQGEQHVHLLRLLVHLSQQVQWGAWDERVEPHECKSVNDQWGANVFEESGLVCEELPVALHIEEDGGERADRVRVAAQHQQTEGRVVECGDVAAWHSWVLALRRHFL